MEVGRAASRGWTWATARPVELVFAGLVLLMYVYSVHVTRTSFFWVDDWLMLRDLDSFGALFEPYNGHLSVTILATWSGLAQLFGFDYLPFRLVGAACVVAVPSGYFLVARRTLGAPVAALLAFGVLTFDELSLFPGELNHHLALIGGMGCAAALQRGPRADWALAAALAFALIGAGGGSAVAAGCVLHNVVTRPPLRRWLVVVVPSAAWAAWYLLLGRDEQQDLQPTVSGGARFVRALTYESFEGLGHGVAPLAYLLMVGFAISVAWQLRGGLRAASNAIAWSGAYVVWAVGLAYSRGALADPHAFRYQFVGAAFLLLAAVPVRRIAVAAQRERDRTWAFAAAAVVLLVGLGRLVVVREDVQEFARMQDAYARQSKGVALVAGVTPELVEDDVALPFTVGFLRVDELREVFRRYEVPFPTTVDDLDRQAREIGIARADLVPEEAVPCASPLEQPFSYVPEAVALRLSSEQPSWTIEVRRFGDDWIRLREAGANQVIRVLLPDFPREVPWEVRAVGACRQSA